MYAFKISDKIIVQQKHVEELIPNQYPTKIIGSIEMKTIKQSNSHGFVTIYDENKNLIAIASLANPVRKLEERSYTFKLKLDI